VRESVGKIVRIAEKIRRIAETLEKNSAIVTSLVTILMRRNEVMLKKSVILFALLAAVLLTPSPTKAVLENRIEQGGLVCVLGCYSSSASGTDCEGATCMVRITVWDDGDFIITWSGDCVSEN
jgi:hypothetical protein